MAAGIMSLKILEQGGGKTRHMSRSKSCFDE